MTSDDRFDAAGYVAVRSLARVFPLESANAPGGPNEADLIINPPSFTETFFEAAQQPKYLLNLLDAEHLPPYSQQQPQLGIVERVTLAFLDGYLKSKRRCCRGCPRSETVPEFPRSSSHGRLDVA
jgi:hypothetical protein